MLDKMSLSFARFSIFILLIVVGASPSLAQPQASASSDTQEPLTALTQIEGVSEYELPNGLKILLAPDQSKPTTTVNMTYLVGARHENYGETGMAHLLEHMLFRGTPTLPNALAEFSRRGLQANGSTSADRTNYYASFAADPETLDWYIRWQADVMINATISRSDLDAEMTVVRNEMERGENNPFQMLMQKMQAAAFQWHNYGKSTIGARSDVENVDIEQLRAFYRLYYQPDNAVLIVSGRFDIDATLEAIVQAFSPIPRPERSLPPEYTIEPVQDGERRVVLRRQGGSPLVAAFYHMPAVTDPSFAALDLGIGILGDTPSGRLYHRLVREGLAASVFGFAAGMAQPGFALFGAQLESSMDQDRALEVLNSTLDSLASEPIEESDLDRMRNKWLTSWSRVYADPVQLASALSEAAAEGDWRLFFWQRDQVKALERDQVQKALEAWLVNDNRTEGLYVPTPEPRRAPAPQAIDVQALLSEYEGSEEAAIIDAFDPTPAHIDAATELSTLDLSSGAVKLALLPKPTRGGRVEAILLMQFSDVEGLQGKRVAAAATASLLGRATSQLSRQEIEDQIDALQANVSFNGGGGSVSARLSTTSEHLPELISLVLHILRDARFPQDELDEFKRQHATATTNAMAEPDALAARALARHANPWPAEDPRYVPTFEESLNDVAALSPEDLQAFHDQFYGSGAISFSAVGAFESEDVKTALATGLEDWPQAPPYTRVPDPYTEVAPKVFHIPTPGKANAFYLAALPLERQDTDADFPALYLANYLLGGSETSRLWERIRTKEGLSYNVRSSLDISSYEASGDWTIYAIFAPENAARLEASIAEELTRVLRDGFTEEEVKEGVHALLNYRKLARTRDTVLASTWLHYLDTQRTFAWSQMIDDALLELTADDVNQALRNALDPDAMTRAVAADQIDPVEEEAADTNKQQE